METSKWTHPSTGEVRHYVNGWQELIGLEIERYGTGNIRWAFLNGEKISNTKARRVGGKFWIDESGNIHADRFSGAGLLDEQDVIKKIQENLK